MKVLHNCPSRNYTLSVDYAQLLATWADPLKYYVQSELHAKLMFSIHDDQTDMNLGKRLLTKKELFKPFTECEYEKTKVVIINYNPVLTRRSNGLAFGNRYSDDNKDYDSVLKHVLKHVEIEEHEGCNIHEDFTLTNWAEQGVLLLNYGFHTNDLSKRHETYYMIKTVINQLCKRMNMVFCFVGKDENKFFRGDITDNHISNVLTSKELSYSLLKNINILIENQHGSSHKIKW